MKHAKPWWTPPRAFWLGTAVLALSGLVEICNGALLCVHRWWVEGGFALAGGVLLLGAALGYAITARSLSADLAAGDPWDPVSEVIRRRPGDFERPF